MANLSRIETLEWVRFQGYLDAAQLMFVHGELNLTIESAFYAVTGSITDDEVVRSTYSVTNEVDYHQEVSMQQMVDGINSVLSLPRVYWKPKDVGVAAFIEKRSGMDFGGVLRPVLISPLPGLSS